MLRAMSEPQNRSRSDARNARGSPGLRKRGFSKASPSTSSGSLSGNGQGAAWTRMTRTARYSAA